MKKVLVLGAGLVSAPLVRYLLSKGYHLTVGDMNEAQAARVIGDHANGQPFKLDLDKGEHVEDLVSQADLVVSLLPPALHSRVARLCLQFEKHFLTASYVDDEMRSLDQEAKSKNLIFLNEVGLDPGIDHMTIMEIIDKLRKQGYTIIEFDSHCGGIPARSAANNAIRYKFSWSPEGVLNAITRPSKYLKNGKRIELPGEDKLKHAEVLLVPGVGIFESNPNADSLYYGELYGLKGLQKVRRGTLRYPGWATFWIFMLKNGFMEKQRRMDLQDELLGPALMKLAGHQDESLYNFILKTVPEQASVFLEVLHTLGFFDQHEKVTGAMTAFELIVRQAKQHLNYGPGEPDLVVLYHEMVVEKDGQRELWTSNLAREGTPGKYTAMAELVGYPAAIACRLILENKIKDRGVLIPLTEELYRPILEELTQLGITHKVERHVLPS